MSRTHAVYTVAHRETLCRRQWRYEPDLKVETEWKLVTCKRCLAKVEAEIAAGRELEMLLRKEGAG